MTPKSGYFRIDHGIDRDPGWIAVFYWYESPQWIRRGENFAVDVIVECESWRNYFTGRKVNCHSSDDGTEQENENEQPEVLDDAALNDWSNDSDDHDRREMIRDQLSRLR